MAKVILTKERRQAERILNSLPRQKIIAKELGISQQLVSYRLKEVYPDQLENIIKILELANYEIKERED